MIEGQAIGYVGELHPRWRQDYELPGAPVLFELSLDAVLARRVPISQAIAKHQAAWRDLALVVPETACHDALVRSLQADPAGLVRDATLFDVYKPTVASGDMQPGERSMAVRLELLDPQATLTEDRIDATVADAVARATQSVGARLRG
jgi:phenylalanyl-tRNA synthetase beta chain